jgi:hypothetical protein
LFKCTIGLFGLPPDATRDRSVDIDLPDAARLTDVIAALKRRIPALEGPVITPGEDRLTAAYAFNVNGRFYTDEVELSIRPCDRVGLLMLATGG